MAGLSNLQKTDERRSIFSIFWFIIRQTWRNSKAVFIGTVFVVLAMVSLQFVGSYSFAQIINILVSPHPTWQAILPFIVLSVALDYIPNILGFLEGMFTSWIEQSLRISLEQLVFGKIAELDIATIEQPDFQDLLYQVQSRGIGGMITINSWLFTLIRQGFRVAISLSLLFVLSKLGLAILIFSTIPIYFYEKWRAKRLGKIFASHSEMNRKAGSRIAVFSNKESAIELKFFKLGNFFLEKIKSVRLEHFHTDKQDDKEVFPLFAGSQLFPSFGVMVSLLAIIKDVINGVRKVGTLSFAWSTLWQFSSAFQTIIRSIGRLEEHGTHASKLMNLLELEDYIPENPNGIIYDTSVVPTIEFRNVSFVYPGSERQVLSNLTTTLDASSEIAIVGLNGAGKTTFLRLLTRVYDPTSGEILVNGKNLCEYNLSSWRSVLGIMLQDYTVYQDEAVKENITFAHGNDDEVLLKQVSDDTGVSEFVVEYEHGFDQMIGKEYRGGVEPSKGQKQKLVLARTLYQKRPVLILDEPTAAIDALSEDRIFKALRENHKDKTRIIISHKFSNVRDADKIILIEHGKIIEEGNHDQLMKKKKGKYKELFELQAEGYK